MTEPVYEPIAEETSGAKREIALEFDAGLAQDVAPAYVTNVAVQRTEHEYILSFFEVLPPLLFGTPEAVMQQIGGMQHAPTRCVARVVIARTRMKEVAELFQRAVAEDPFLSAEH